MLAATLSVVLASSASAADKGFTATIVSGAPVPAGATRAVVVRLTNTSDTPQSFGSANITLPTGFTLVSASVPSPGTVLAPATNNPVRVRSLNVRRNSSVDVTVTVRVACGTSPSGSLAIQVKQSNDFNGTGNDFTPDAPMPTLATTGSCSLQWDSSRQPTETAANTTITWAAYTPDAARIRVRALDGTGALATTYTGTVTLTVGQPSGSTATLSGGTTATAVGGVAEFTPRLDTPTPTGGTPYRLRASATNFTSADSAEFVIAFGAVQQCVASDSVTCTTGDFASPNGNLANITLNDADSVTGRIVAKFTGATFSCEGYPRTSDVLEFDVISSSSLNGLTKTITIVQSLQTGRPNATDYQVCFQAPYDFPAVRISELLADFSAWNFSNNTVVTGSAPNQQYTGLLLPCDAGFGVPCVSSRTVAAGKVTVKFETKAADPRAWV